MTGFGSGWVALDENGKWLPPRGPSLHPADAVRLVISAVENDGPVLAGLIAEHGWIRWCPPELREAALGAESAARAQLVNWLRSGELVAQYGRNDIKADDWRRRIDVDAPSTWWPVDAPGQGCWRVSRFELDALLQPLRAARLGAPELPPVPETLLGKAKLPPMPEAQLKTLAGALAAKVGQSFGLVKFTKRLMEEGRDLGWHITRERAAKEGERLSVKTVQGKKPASQRNIPE